jgi:cation transport regulator ChaC
MKLRYFAYGSNMLEQWLTQPARVPGARFRFIGSVRGYRLEFNKRGKDGSGKCNMESTHEAGDVVNGVIYEIPEDEMPRLDTAEGLGRGYYHSHVPVQYPDGAVMPVLTYLADAASTDTRLKPYAWYLDLVIAGAEQHGLPADYLAFLKRVPCVPDPDAIRQAGEKARQILAGLARPSTG